MPGSNRTLPENAAHPSPSFTLDATVAICTWNRASLLDQTLARFRDMQVPSGCRWELVVVNNNCTDKTDDVIAHYAESLPIRGLHEPRAGLSNARNCAVKAARGSLLLWTDDDVLVDPSWLSNYLAVAAAHPEDSFFGGPIEPWFEEAPPAWLVSMLGVPGIPGVFALRDLGSEAFRIDSTAGDRLPYGANYAVRTEIHRQYSYDPELGRKETGTLSGEETLLLQQLIDAGHIGRWIPAASVQHFIPQERLTREYVRHFFVGLGRTRQRLAQQSPSALSRAWLFCQLCYSQSMYGIHRLANHHRGCARHLIHGCQVWGRLNERVPPRVATKTATETEENRSRLAARRRPPRAA